MESAEQAAITAFEGAARALSAGRAAGPSGDKVSEVGKPHVAAAVADMLDAAVRLLRTVDLQPPAVGGPGHSMRAIAQHMNAGAELARRMGSNRGFDAGHTSHPEPRSLTE
ncbi:hypothetical protein [Actinomycetospora flava]|uniref:Uncharacterized protein n=1 Tax=Actinomycetospora flava TaxID=3129232 RepID=A0ABU8MD43_9PSEU